LAVAAALGAADALAAAEAAALGAAALAAAEAAALGDVLLLPHALTSMTTTPAKAAVVLRVLAMDSPPENLP
jgi:hypothetical protein